MPTDLAAHAALTGRRQRQVRKVQRLQQVHALAQQGYSYSAIARQNAIAVATCQHHAAVLDPTPSRANRSMRGHKSRDEVG